jgi:hypothetical protein
MYVGMFMVILCILEALAGGNKRRFLRLLTKEFSEVCASIAPADFYKNYRNALVHEFQFREYYAILEDDEAEGKPVRLCHLPGSSAVITGLNVDHFALKTVALLDRRIASLGKDTAALP